MNSVGIVAGDGVESERGVAVAVVVPDRDAVLVDDAWAALDEVRGQPVLPDLRVFDDVVVDGDHSGIVRQHGGPFSRNHRGFGAVDAG